MIHIEKNWESNTKSWR